jgi:hypothetical protein
MNGIIIAAAAITAAEIFNLWALFDTDPQNQVKALPFVEVALSYSGTDCTSYFLGCQRRASQHMFCPLY